MREQGTRKEDHTLMRKTLSTANTWKLESKVMDQSLSFYN